MMMGNTAAMTSPCPMMGGGWGPMMMIGMGLVWILIVLVLVLGIAALIKYLRSGGLK
ncbi:MAG: hypothetical protein M3Q19_04295 [Pseudomonadota bacterium]|nr:hypothetical protein [Pseudomonadota bacterium]